MADFGYSTEARPLDTPRILEALRRHEVDYVLVGGIAAIVHGSARVTVDADVLPRPDPANLARLLDALRDLGAAVFVDERRARMESGEPWEVEMLRRGSAALLEADAWHFTTDAGQVDVLFDAAGVGGFDEHAVAATVHDVFGIEVAVAAIDHLIASKEALGRAKDLPVLEDLREIRDDRLAP